MQEIRGIPGLSTQTNQNMNSFSNRARQAARLIIAAIFMVSFSAAGQQYQTRSKQELKLWYKQAADQWMKALPIGNGRLGAMIFGGVHQEQLQLNEESVWAGKKVNNNNPDALKNLPQIRQLIFDGKADEAMALANKALNGNPGGVKSYQPLGDLMLDFDHKGTAQNYKRELDLRTGVHRVQYDINGKSYSREIFASAPANALVILLETTAPEGVNMTIGMSREKDAIVKTSGNSMTLSGQVDGKGMKFETLLQVYNEGGKLIDQQGKLKVEGARSVKVILTAATDYNADKMDVDPTKDPDVISKNILTALKGKTYAALKAAHIADHQPMMERVELSLGADSQVSLPTDERLQAVKNNAFDPGLETILFQYGRYLLMGSSRAPGVLPANLQGIWNKELNAPWNADFHTNINLQMNYWPAEVTNLSETTRPLIHFMQALEVPGRQTARQMYGARGWTVHHLTDAFGHTAVHDGVTNGMFPMGGPWMTQPIFEHYEFNGDQAFLRKTAYPMMKESSQFVLDILVRDQKNRLVTSPSYSPENNYVDPVTGKGSKLTYAPTMDMEIINDLFIRTRAAARILHLDAKFTDTLSNTMKQLVPVQLAKDGSIQEWVEDYKETEPGHRHVSHLFALHPSDQITPMKTPELFEGARKTLAKRLKNGGAGTGWSRAWTINFFARLKDGNAAHEHITALFQRSIAQNLFDLHPPFQIDGNFGYTAGVAEMLLQSQEGEIGDRIIELLPALPAAWGTGSVSGLKTRGNFEVALNWASGKLVHAKFKSVAGNSCTLSYPGIGSAKLYSAGKRFIYKKISDNVIRFNTIKGKTYEISGVF